MADDACPPAAEDARAVGFGMVWLRHTRSYGRRPLPDEEPRAPSGWNAPPCRLLARPVLRLAIGAGAAVFGLASLDLPLGHLVPPDAYYDKDFLQDYLLGKAVLDGVDPYLPLQALSVRYVANVPDLGAIPVS